MTKTIKFELFVRVSSGVGVRVKVSWVAVHDPGLRHDPEDEDPPPGEGFLRILGHRPVPLFLPNCPLSEEKH